MSTKAKATEKPLIQIDDEIREMTDQEYESYLELISTASALPEL
jgi:hypothetical protein